MRAAYVSIGAFVVGLVAAALNLPGGDAVAQWLVSFGLLGALVSAVFGLAARRRERRAAEAEAAAELDRYGD